MDLIEHLNWRYATKRMNGNIVPQEKLDRILEAIRLSASSAGLQPYSIIVVENPEMKQKLSPVAYNQPQIIEASHLLIFAAWDNVTEVKIDEYMNKIAEVRGISVDSLSDFRNRLIGMTSQSSEVNYNWAARQTYIALGTGLIAAAIEGVDATPMEGFNAEGVDVVLGLKELGLKTVSFLALGYRDTQNDFLANAKKVRRDKKELFINM